MNDFIEKISINKYSFKIKFELAKIQFNRFLPSFSSESFCSSIELSDDSVDLF